MIGLKTINEDLLYKVLSIPTYTGKEYRMIEYLMNYASEKGYIYSHIFIEVAKRRMKTMNILAGYFERAFNQ